MPKPSGPTPRATRRQLERLRDLTEAVAVSGDESAVRRIVRREIEGLADRVWTDAIGNLLAVRRGTGRIRARVLVAAHMDEVGLMMVDADGDGTLRFEIIGSVDVRTLPAKPLWIGRGRLPGVVAVKPMHLLAAGETENALDPESLRVDIGASTRQEALLRVPPGTWASFATPFERSGPVLRGKALDDRLGVASLIELLEHPPAGIELLAAFTVQEEIGQARGARVAAFALDPDAALVLDATPARELPSTGTEEPTAYNARMGAGPAIYVSDRATISHPRLVELLTETARALRIPFQFRQPGGGGTDANSIHRTRAGIPSVSLSVPVRYPHTPLSLAHLGDWRVSLRLAHAALQRLDRRTLRL